MREAIRARWAMFFGRRAASADQRRLRRVFDREGQRLRDARQGGGKLLIEAAASLWALDGEPRYVEAIARRLREASDQDERIEAAEALSHTPSPRANDALFDALDDVDPLVRHVAARSLMRNHGVSVDAHVLLRVADRLLRDPPPARLRIGRAP